jgi:hypothetical protein
MCNAMEQFDTRDVDIEPTIQALSTRVFNCLTQWYGLSETATKADVRRIYAELVTGARSGGRQSIKNFGLKSLDEVSAWLGMAPPAVSRCPICGARIRFRDEAEMGERANWHGIDELLGDGIRFRSGT